MAPKRKREPDLPPNYAEAMHPSRKYLLTTHQFPESSTYASAEPNSAPKTLPKKPKKSKKPNPFPDGTSRQKKHQVGPLKKRIRDLKRQLAKLGDELPADVRVEKERELQACEWSLQTEEAEIRRKQLVGQYHMVRFFERQKATKRLKAAKKALANAKGDTSNGNDAKTPRPFHRTLEKLEQAVRNAEVDLNYTLYYPLSEPYVSLFPKLPRRIMKRHMPEAEQAEQAENEEGEDDAADSADGAVDVRKRPGVELDGSEGPRGNIDMRARVEKAMQEGPAALEALRNEVPMKYLESRLSGRFIRPETYAMMAQRGTTKGKEVHERKEEDPETEEEDEVVMKVKDKGKSKAIIREQKKAKITGAEAMNRRERRAAMRQLEEEMAREEEDSDGGFFEEDGGVKI